MIEVRPARPTDAASWLRLRAALWPDSSEGEHAREIEGFFAGAATEPVGVLLAVDPSAGVVGFAELSTRPCAEGCRTSPVAYLEGWFVAPDARRRGVGRALIRAAEEWARAHGCGEFASDTGPDNLTSAAAHRAVGFGDAGLVRCFRKDLQAGPGATGAAELRPRAPTPPTAENPAARRTGGDGSGRQIENTIPVLVVRDLERSVAFYRDVLGFEVEWSAGAICSVARDGCSLMLQAGAEARPATVWIGLAGESLLAAVGASRAQVVEPPANRPWAYEMKIADPDGNVLWLGAEPRAE